MKVFKEFYNRSNTSILDMKILDRDCMIQTSNMLDYSVQSTVYFFGNTKQIWPIFVSVALGLLSKPSNESYQSLFEKIMNGQYSLGSLYPQKIDPEKNKQNMYVYNDGKLVPTGDNYVADPNYSIDIGFDKFIKGEIKSYSVTQGPFFQIVKTKDSIISYKNHLNEMRNDLLTKDAFTNAPDYNFRMSGGEDEQTINDDFIQKLKVSIEINEKTLQLIKLGKPFGHTMDAEDWSEQVWNTDLPSAPIYQWIEKQTIDGDL